jgi:hypothetical protein
MSGGAKKRARRVIDRIARPYVGALEESVTRLGAELETTHEELLRVKDAVRMLADDEAANRRRLYELRRDPTYELAFTEEEPLVSFVIPTYDRYGTLRDVAVPSILSQSYSNVEVIVIGDGSPPETEAVIAEIGDPRVTFFNRPYRGPYPENDRERWLMSGSPPFNDGLSRVTGRWIAPMADDDAVRPEHTRTLIDAAQRHRHELCYGRMAIHFEDGRGCDFGVFPPRLGGVGLQASIYHAGLGFLHSQAIDAAFGEPNDWSRIRRMLAIGVYVGMADEVVTDKYETRLTPEHYMFVGPNSIW